MTAAAPTRPGRLRRWMRASGSVRARVVIVVGILGAMLGVLSGYAIWEARRTHADAGAAVRIVPDRVFLSDVAAMIDRDLIDVYAAVQATEALTDDARLAMDARFRADDADVAAGIHAMADRATAFAITGALQDHRARRRATLDEAQRLALVRRPSATRIWLAETDAFLAELGRLAERAIPLDAVIDARMALLLELLRGVEDLSKHATVRGSLVGGHIASRAHLTVDAVAEMQAANGAMRLALDGIA